MTDIESIRAAEIKPGGRYLLFLGDAWNDATIEALDNLQETLSETFPGSKFVTVAGAVGIAEAADD